VNAGDGVTFSSGGVTTDLEATTAGGRTRYQPAGGTASHTPGATITFATTGVTGGFPAGSLTGLSAEAFTLNPIPLSVEGTTDFHRISWTPEGDDNSLIVLRLQYAASGSTVVNRELLCSLIDDGVALMPEALMEDYVASAMRHNIGQRWRASYRLLSDNANAMVILSHYDVTAGNVP
jgi:hypothetical protein